MKQVSEVSLFKKKPQVKVKSRSKAMPVFVFYLLCHLLQTCRTAANFLYNSSLKENVRNFQKLK